MQDQRRVIILAKACVIVGIALAIHGVLADSALTFRPGILITLLSALAHLHMTSRANTREVMAHRAHLARMSAQERQQYTEIGWRAALLDALTEDAPTAADDAEIVHLPRARTTPQMRRDGSA
ncbi:hypothetical protein [Streptomyces sp. C1-2]|uniref:hypothetical protein n=1 Tax=Streptomyces sp. C1-2 TaxID=2720022 RepID=UPI0014324998|nr:hypothetical protein [Streptomyces sp. C1-2]NJP71942.1 hypothetical protein [Streptomyces sp. C1-2]